MHVLGVVTDADAGVVAQQAGDTRAQRGPHGIARLRSRVQPDGRHLGGPGGTRAESVHQLGPHVVPLGARRQQPLGDRVHDVDAALVGGLDLELAEAAGDGATVVDDDPIVDHLDLALAFGAVQLHARARRSEAGDLRELVVAQVGAQQLQQLGRHLGRWPVELELAAHEGGAALAFGELHRPTRVVAGAIANGEPPPGQAQIERVVVRRREALAGQG